MGPCSDRALAGKLLLPSCSPGHRDHSARAGLLSLTEMSKRLQQDHDNALMLAKGLASSPHIDIRTDLVCTPFKKPASCPINDEEPSRAASCGQLIDTCCMDVCSVSSWAMLLAWPMSEGVPGHITLTAWKMRVESDWVAYAGAHQHRRVQPVRALPLDGQGLHSGAAAAWRAFDSLQVRPFSLCECSLHLKCPPQVGQAIWSLCAYAPCTVHCRRMRPS